MSKTGDDLTRVTVRLAPKASRDAIAGWAADADGKPYLKASVTAAPDKGKANKALIALLAREWGIPKSSIEIVKGAADRHKTLLIRNIPGALKTKLISCK